MFKDIIKKVFKDAYKETKDDIETTLKTGKDKIKERISKIEQIEKISKMAEGPKLTESLKRKEPLKMIKKPKRKTLYIIGGLILIVVVLFFVYGRKGVEQPIVTIDDFPIWLMRDGKVAVYRELNLYKDSMEKQIVVVNLSDEDQEDIEIYEVIPKEFAQSASELEFSVQPEIIEDDPIILWSVGPAYRELDPPVFTFRKYTSQKNILEMFDKCRIEDPEMDILEKFDKEEAVAQEIADEWGLDIGNVRVLCLRHWRSKHKWAQELAEKELQIYKEKLEVINPGDEDYEDIKKKAKKAITEDRASRAKEKKEEEEKEEEEKKSDEEKSFGGTVFLSEGDFPSTLLGLPRQMIQTAPQAEGCHTKFPANRYLSGFYQSGSEALLVVLAQYSDNESAKAFPGNCTNYSNETILAEMNSSAKLEKKNNISVYPFWLMTATIEGQHIIIGSFSVVMDTVIQTMIPTGNGGTESEHREAVSAMINRLKTGCSGDTDCKDWVCENCDFGRKICSKGECVACTYDGHCKSGYKCENNRCIGGPSGSPEPSEPSEPVCGRISLDRDYKVYTYTRDGSVCSSYKNTVSSNEVSLRCGAASPSWRGHWVKEIEVGGLDKVYIEADIGLIDHSRFFTECGGKGVKYDNYVSFLVLSSDPRSTLNRECNKISSSSDWPKCAVRDDDSSVLAQCGVPRCKTQADCDFVVDVSGLNKIYLVFRTGDAWLADLEGVLANVDVCGVAQQIVF